MKIFKNILHTIESSVGKESLSLRYFILRAFMINILVSLSLASVAYIFNYFISFRSNLVTKMTSTSKVLSYNLTTSLEFQDVKDALKMLQSLSTDPEILSATILNIDGTLLVSYGDKLSVDTLRFVLKLKDTQSEFYDNKLFYTHPIVKSDGSVLGSLVIAHSLAPLYSQYYHFAAIAFFVMVICSLFAYFISRKFQISLIRPIDQFVTIISDITKKENYSLRTQSQTQHIDISEIKNLALSFDSMLEQIENRDIQVKKAHDILEEKVEERTADLIKTQQDLIASTSRLATLGEMSASIAHEINNPLSVIMMNCAKLTRKLQGSELKPEEMIETVKKVQKMSNKIAKIVKSLKTFSRDGSHDPFEVISLKTILEDTLELCMDRFKNTNVELKIGEIPDVSIECRSTQIGQVYMNILNNAFDAIQGFKEKWVQVNFELNTQEVKVIITDCGSGIPENIRLKIMEPFFTTKEVGKGTGLGLSISRSIIETHKGNLVIDSECANTRFIITLPLAQSAHKHKDMRSAS